MIQSGQNDNVKDASELENSNSAISRPAEDASEDSYHAPEEVESPRDSFRDLESGRKSDNAKSKAKQGGSVCCTIMYLFAVIVVLNLLVGAGYKVKEFLFPARCSDNSTLRDTGEKSI